MDVEIVATSAAQLPRYAAVTAAFEVSAVLDVAHARRQFTLTERQLATPWVKDYDAIHANAPRNWTDRFRLEEWGLFAAQFGGNWIGGVAVAPDATLAPHFGLGDAVLWDLRVAPSHRGRGIGRALFAAAEQWARSRARSAIVAETQNVNVAACRLYERCGCTLEHVHWRAYADFPDEVRLVWRKAIP